MSLKNYFKKIRDAYVINQVKNIKLPQKLALTGWVKNNMDKNVEAEIQGEDVKINFLINYMKSLKRASVHNVVINEIPILKHETDFVVIKDTASV